MRLFEVTFKVAVKVKAAHAREAEDLASDALAKHVASNHYLAEAVRELDPEPDPRQVTLEEVIARAKKRRK